MPTAPAMMTIDFRTAVRVSASMLLMIPFRRAPCQNALASLPVAMMIALVSRSVVALSAPVTDLSRPFDLQR